MATFCKGKFIKGDQKNGHSHGTTHSGQTKTANHADTLGTTRQTYLLIYRGQNVSSLIFYLIGCNAKMDVFALLLMLGHGFCIEQAGSEYLALFK